MTIEKPYAPACDRNREPILTVIKRYFADRTRVLEVGSGTGQHAVYFAAALPQLTWQCSDVVENISGITQWLQEAQLPNTPLPLTLNVNESWPTMSFDAVFSANTLHIMSWTEVQRLFAKLDGVLTSDAVLAVYGPFNYEGRFTSSSNAQFDRALKARHEHMGIRDFEQVNDLAGTVGLTLIEDCPMPANNRTLVWRRR